MVTHLITTFGISIREACPSLNLSRTVYHYRPDTTRYEPVIAALSDTQGMVLGIFSNTCDGRDTHEIAKGFTGFNICILNFRLKGKQRLQVRNLSPLATPEALSQNESVDSMHDALGFNRRFHTFNVIDDFNREALSTEYDLNLPALCVVRVLNRIAATLGSPVMQRKDNGSKFVPLPLAKWAGRLSLKKKLTQPG